MNRLLAVLAAASCFVAIPALASGRSFSTMVPAKVAKAAKAEVKSTLGSDVRISGAKFTRNWTVQALNAENKVVVLKVSPGGKVLDYTSAMHKSSMDPLNFYQSGGSDAL